MFCLVWICYQSRLSEAVRGNFAKQSYKRTQFACRFGSSPTGGATKKARGNRLGFLFALFPVGLFTTASSPRLCGLGARFALQTLLAHEVSGVVGFKSGRTGRRGRRPLQRHVRCSCRGRFGSTSNEQMQAFVRKEPQRKLEVIASGFFSLGTAVSPLSVDLSTHL